MDSTLFVWVVLLAAFVAANVPFLNQRFWGLLPLPGGQKRWWVLLIEILLAYGVALGLGWYLEHVSSQIYRQGWEFYVVTVCLFLTFAFPGFVFRFLWRRR